MIAVTKGLVKHFYRLFSIVPFVAGFHDIGFFPYIMDGFDRWFHGIGFFSYTMEGFDAGFHDIGFFPYTMECFGSPLPRYENFSVYHGKFVSSAP